MSNHVPAWKRLGLKLKYANDTPANQQDAKLVSYQDKSQQALPETTISKRKVKHVKTNGDGVEPVSKRIRLHDSEHMPDRAIQMQSNSRTASPPQRPPMRKKSVSFASDTKAEDGDSAYTIPLSVPDSPGSTLKKLKKKEKASHIQQSTISNGDLPRKSRLALDYIDQHYRGRSAWKFNKTREIWIVNHLLSTDDIPVAYNTALANYLHGLKSEGAKERIVKSCRESLEGLKTSTDKSRDDASSHTEAISKFVHGLKNDQLRILIDDSEDLTEWMMRQKRPEVILWALNEPTNEVTEDLFNKKMPTYPSAIQHKAGILRANGTSLQQVKKSKARTSRIEVDSDTSSSDDVDSEDSTSSGESTSDSDSESESDSDSNTTSSESGSSSASSESTSSSEDSDSDEQGPPHLQEY